MFKIDLGPCCACGVEGETVLNVISLPYEGPVPGKGWGCFQCGLPPNGAVAVICDRCLEEKAEIKFVCKGYPTDGRVPIGDSSKKPFHHNYKKHPQLAFRN